MFLRLCSCYWFQLLVVLSSIASNSNTVVYGWGKEGHEIIGNLAYRLLSNETQMQIQAILNPSNYYDNENNDNDDDNDYDGDMILNPLGDIATWADEVKHLDKYHWSSSLHYIDVRDDLLDDGCHYNVDDPTDQDCHFTYNRDCEDDWCVVGAIMNYTKRLQQWQLRAVAEAQQQQHEVVTTTSTEDTDIIEVATQYLLRGSMYNDQNKDNDYNGDNEDESVRESLMFLTHFVGDVHQPLHCSRTSDIGGNSIHVKFAFQSIDPTSQYRTRTSRIMMYDNDDSSSRVQKHHHHGWNLHSIWDSGIIEKSIREDYNNSQKAFEENIWDQIVLPYYDDIDDNNYNNNNAKNNRIDSSRTVVECPPGKASKECISAWGEESLQLALQYAYMDAHEEEVVDGMTLDEQYFTTRLPVIEKQLAIASIRLANVLEDAMSLQ